MKKIKRFFEGVIFAVIAGIIISVFGLLFIDFINWEITPVEKIFSFDGGAGIWWRIWGIIILACGILLATEKDA